MTSAPGEDLALLREKALAVVRDRRARKTRLDDDSIDLIPRADQDRDWR